MGELLNSTIVTYKATASGLTSMDGTLVLSTPIMFKADQARKVRLIRASVSTQIPNIYQLGTFNNGLLRVTKDGGLNWLDIQLPNGIYTISYIMAAIAETTPTWWTDIHDPGIALAYNLATFYTYITLDSTKLAAPGQVGIDLSPSLIREVLGYNAVTTFVVDGVYGGDEYPQIDWVGNNISVNVDGMGGLSYVGGNVTTELCQIPMIITGSRNEYVYPYSGLISPFLNISPPSRFDTIHFRFTGDRIDPVTGIPRPIYLLDGNVIVSLQISWGKP